MSDEKLYWVKEAGILQLKSGEVVEFGGEVDPAKLDEKRLDYLKGRGWISGRAPLMASETESKKELRARMATLEKKVLSLADERDALTEALSAAQGDTSMAVGQLQDLRGEYDKLIVAARDGETDRAELSDTVTKLDGENKELREAVAKLQEANNELAEAVAIGGKTGTRKRTKK